MKNKLTLIRGLPGSGKSTYARGHYNCLILENDMFHMKNGEYMWEKDNMPVAIMWCRNTCRDSLLCGMDVVVANTFTKKSAIDVYKRIADECGAEFDVVRCTKNYGNIHNVPSFVLENMENNFEDWPGETIV